MLKPPTIYTSSQTYLFTERGDQSKLHTQSSYITSQARCPHPLPSQQMGLTALPPGAFLQGVSELGIPLLNDPNSGISAGAMIAPSSISSKNQSRVDSRTAYLDGVISRPNLHVAPGQTVTRILIDPDGSSPNLVVPIFGHLQRAYGVEVRTTS